MKEKKYDKDFIEDIIAEVKQDYLSRREERRSFEAQWQLNSAFLTGNQFCDVSPSGVIEETGKDYFWQERQVYNHIAFIVETRLAKLSKVRPKMSVRPSSGDVSDIKSAEVSGKILESTYNKLNVENILEQGTQWSETAGCVFYKVSWDKNTGYVLGSLEGEIVHEGEIRIDVCPPYEIFPDNMSCQNINELSSIIHAKAVSVEDIERIWGKIVLPEEIDSIAALPVVGGNTSFVNPTGRVGTNSMALVVERYTMPTKDKPRGELAIVAGNQLLHYGELPFCCGENGSFALPFIKQDSQIRAGCFFGTSIIERAIPVQRAYNAVKNRKHEFLNRIAMGVIAVEDGSVDTDNLETEGLCPGKILVYRQGSVPPALLPAGNVPADFSYEEDKLLNEFIMISGVSEVMRSSSIPSNISSGAALQLLLEQDDTRLSATAERVRFAAKQIARFIIRLYKQFARHTRLSRCVGEEGEIELVNWKASNLDSDDVVFDTENELNSSAASRRNMILELLRLGLLHDESGKLSDTMRYKILDAFGYGSWEYTRDIQRMQSTRAQRENNNALVTPPIVKEIDDHQLHLSEHIKFMLSSEYDSLIEKTPELDVIMTQHVTGHKDKLMKKEILDERTE
jgi:hypothetical protein